MTTLAGIADANSNNALSITVTDASVAAADLNALDAKTTVAITDGGIATVTGAYADVHTAFTNSATDGLGGDEAVTLTDTTMTATDLNTLDGDTSGSIDASSVTALSGTLHNVNIAYTSAGITGMAGTNVTISDTSATGTDINTLESHLTASSQISTASGVLTVTALNGLTIDGTASDDTFDFVSGGAATGVTINNFEVGGVNDDIDLDGNQVNTGGTVYEESSGAAFGQNTALFVDTSNTNIAGTTTTDINNLFTADGLSFNAASDQLFFVAHDANNTYLFNIADTDSTLTTVENSTLVATLTGIADADTLTSADFVDFQ